MQYRIFCDPKNDPNNKMLHICSLRRTSARNSDSVHYLGSRLLLPELGALDTVSFPDSFPEPRLVLPGVAKRFARPRVYEEPEVDCFFVGTAAVVTEALRLWFKVFILLVSLSCFDRRSKNRSTRVSDQRFRTNVFPRAWSI